MFNASAAGYRAEPKRDAVTIATARDSAHVTIIALGEPQSAASEATLFKVVSAQ